MKLTKSKLKEIIREVIKEEEESALDKARAKALNQKTKEREVAHKKKHADWFLNAKEAKKHAIQAYLEAKRIKSVYLLDEIESSDDELDFEAYAN